MTIQITERLLIYQPSLKFQDCLNTLRCFPFGPWQETENRQTDRQVGRAMIRLLLAGFLPQILEFDASVRSPPGFTVEELRWHCILSQ